MKYFIHLPMKMEPIVSSETSAVRTQTPGNYPKRNKLYSLIITTLVYKYVPSITMEVSIRNFSKFMDIRM